MEALIESAPLLVASCLASLFVSVAQTLTGIQEQTLTTVPRLLVVSVVTAMSLPWMIHRLVNFTLHIFADLSRSVGH
jgi:flagellar biosynthetic protein FliQ